MNFLLFSLKKCLFRAADEVLSYYRAINEQIIKQKF